MADEFDVGLDGDDEVVPIPAAVPRDDALIAERKRRLECALPLEEYVAREVAITKAQIAAGGIGSHAIDDPVGRVARTESYARWRWNGYLACEIDSL